MRKGQKLAILIPHYSFYKGCWNCFAKCAHLCSDVIITYNRTPHERNIFMLLTLPSILLPKRSQPTARTCPFTQPHKSASTRKAKRWVFIFQVANSQRKHNNKIRVSWPVVEISISICAQWIHSILFGDIFPSVKWKVSKAKGMICPQPPPQVYGWAWIWS